MLRPGTVGCCTVLGSTWGCPHSGTRMRWMEHTHSLEGSWARGSLLHAQHRAMRRDGVPGGAPPGAPSSAHSVASAEGFPGTNYKHILSTCPESKTAHPCGTRRMLLHLFIKHTASKRGKSCFAQPQTSAQLLGLSCALAGAAPQSPTPPMAQLPTVGDAGTSAPPNKVQGLSPSGAGAGAAGC